MSEHSSNQASSQQSNSLFVESSFGADSNEDSSTRTFKVPATLKRKRGEEEQEFSSVKISKLDEKSSPGSVSFNPDFEENLPAATLTKLGTLEISVKRYRHEKSQLQKLGYADKDINRLILRKHSTKKSKHY